MKFYELPIKIPARKTSALPSGTCNTADTSGVPMNLCRTQEMMLSSASTTPTATAVAVLLAAHDTELFGLLAIVRLQTIGEVPVDARAFLLQ